MPLAWVTAQLTRMAATSARRPAFAMAVLLIITVIAGVHGSVTFRIDSDTEKLIRQDTDWRRQFDQFQAAFPMLVDTALVVVSGTSFEAVDGTVVELAQALEDADDVITSVFAPDADPFLRDRRLLFLTPEELDGVIGQLAAAQPALAQLSADPSLRGLFDLLTTGIEARENGRLPAMLPPLIEDVRASASDVAAGGAGAIRWLDRILGTDQVDGLHYGIIVVQGEIDFDEARPYARMMQRLRQVIAATGYPADVQVRLTGEAPLAHEEVQAATDGVGLAGSVALVLLAIVLVFGVRSLRVVLATFAMLAMGFAWTISWAMLSVGEFTTLSIIFLVMFFGLGVDFAIHYALRVQEALARPEESALPEQAAAGNAGGAIALCTLTSSIGFLAYMVTDYRGLAELGYISAGGMVIALFLTFSVIPAFFGLFGRPRPLAAKGMLATSPGRSPWDALVRHAGWLLGSTAILATIAVWQAGQMRFDYSVLALRNPASESMQTLAELQTAEQVTDYSLSVLTDAEEAPEITERLRQLPSVAAVQTPADAVPDRQDEKQDQLADAQAIVGAALWAPEQLPAPTPAEREEAAHALLDAIEAALADPDLAAEHQSLLTGLRRDLEAVLDHPERASRLRTVESGATGSLPDLFAWLERALMVTPFTFDELPAGVRERLIGPEERQHLVVLPAEDISEVSALNRFIEDVRGVAPNATGRPVAEWGVGAIVVAAFIQALVTALILIFLVLLLTLRSLRDAVLVLTPLLLAALFTVATARLLNMPFNMANILVLPLIFGLGVDNGIHLVQRYRSEGRLDALMTSSTPRAVLLSSLTTAGTFAALSLSPHQGTASIGMLLAIAIGWLLLTTLVLLPVLLHRFARTSAA